MRGIHYNIYGMMDEVERVKLNNATRPNTSHGNNDSAARGLR